jgi:hypothetical protein
MSKRRGNANLKLRRARSWLRGEERHKARDAAQAAAHQANLKAGASPWEAACKMRSAIRAADPEVQRRRHNHEAGLR